MFFVKVRDKNQGGKTVAEMPLIVWQLTGWLCKHEGALGLLGGHILNSYEWDYGTGRSWWASLVSGIRIWLGCSLCY